MKINYLGYVKSILKETRTLHSYEAKFLAATVQCYYFELLVFRIQVIVFGYLFL